VWEEQPAVAEEALEWILLGAGPVQNFAQARTWALQYATRWVIEVCQSQPVKMAWCPLRVVITTIIYLRGVVKREDIRDVDLFSCNDDFFDQTLRHGLAISKGQAI
jgi:hypothetical protein